ncbi:hypothetical protein ABZ215_02195 [Amycolatopsis sp. NPDC006131]|uniref:hypothetical protein n=1 Tax=Amycolatopsis sp. NPDC006131 TaxID=3156731 RepID=UPI0033B64399
MARTILRDRSDDLVWSVQLADRTGIVAASAPKPVEDDEPTVADFPPVSGELALAPVVVDLPGAVEKRRLLRQVRRNLLVAAAAVVLVGVGWIAGGAFGPGQDAETAPAVAAGVVPNAGVNQPVQPAPNTSSVPQVPVTTAPPVAPPTAKTSAPVQKKPTTTKKTATDRGEARTGPVEETTEQGKPLGQTLDEQIKQLFEVWTWNQIDPRGDFDEEQDRSPRSFGPLGR